MRTCTCDPACSYASGTSGASMFWDEADIVEHGGGCREVRLRGESSHFREPFAANEMSMEMFGTSS